MVETKETVHYSHYPRERERKRERKRERELELTNSDVSKMVGTKETVQYSHYPCLERELKLTVRSQ